MQNQMQQAIIGRVFRQRAAHQRIAVCCLIGLMFIYTRDNRIAISIIAGNAMVVIRQFFVQRFNFA